MMFGNPTAHPPVKSIHPSQVQHIPTTMIYPQEFSSTPPLPRHPMFIPFPEIMFAGCVASLVTGSRIVAYTLLISPRMATLGHLHHPHPLLMHLHPLHTVLPFPRVIMFVGCVMFRDTGLRIVNILSPDPIPPLTTNTIRIPPMAQLLRDITTRAIAADLVLLPHFPLHPLHRTFVSCAICQAIGSNSAPALSPFHIADVIENVCLLFILIYYLPLIVTEFVVLSLIKCVY